MNEGLYDKIIPKSGNKVIINNVKLEGKATISEKSLCISTVAFSIPPVENENIVDNTEITHIKVGKLFSYYI